MLLICLKEGMSSAQWSITLKVCPQCSAVVSMGKLVVTVAMYSPTTGKYKIIPDDRNDTYYLC